MDDSNNHMNSASDEAAAEDKPDKQCYICWECNETEDDPIRRDCGCKGSMGHAHVRCLIQSVESTDGLLRPWKRCPYCLQPYNDPTKSALNRALVGDSEKWKQRVLSSVTSTTKLLLVYVALFLIQNLFVVAMTYCVDKQLSPMLDALLNQAFVDYASGHFLSGSIVQLVVVGCALAGLSYRYWRQIVPFVKRVLLPALAAVITKNVAKEITGADEWIILAVGALFFLSYWAHRNRIEIRHHGWLSTMAQPVLILGGLAISRFIRVFVTTFFENWNVVDDDGGREL